MPINYVDLAKHIQALEEFHRYVDALTDDPITLVNLKNILRVRDFHKLMRLLSQARIEE